MKRLIALLIIVALLVSGCNWPAVLSIGSDLVALRVDREAAGKPHIEDVFKEEAQR